MNLVWFRNDLRVTDNTALWNARLAGPVLAVFLIAFPQWQQHHISPVQTRFRLRTLMALQARLNRLGIPLMVTEIDHYRESHLTILEIARQYRCSNVYWNNEYPLDELRRDNKVEDALTSHNIRCHRFDDLTLLPPGIVLNQQGEPYKVFTPFKKRYLEILGGGDMELLPEPEPQKPPAITSSDLQPLLDKTESDIEDSSWPAGEEVARKQLDEFIDQHLERYQVDRDFPCLEGTSRLSHHLAVGAISLRTCYREAGQVSQADATAAEGGQAWQTELIWRDFYQHLIVNFPELGKHKPFKPETDALPWRYADENFKCWCEGRTGVPLVDAGMRQLAQTGWMHNRVRMITAMFLTKNLLIDWRRGEQFFMQHLVDGDFAANNGGWQWSASTGTDAAPYFRIFNPFSQAQRWDKDAAYIKRFVPELADLPPSVIHDQAKLAASRPVDYPGLIVDLKASREIAIAAFKNLN